MTRVTSTREIDYPESDGRPMGETDLHRWWMFQIHQLLEYRYRNQDVYVGCDLLLFYVEGDPKKFVVPDNFVVLDCEKGFRRSFKIWVEGKVPNVVFEVTSRRTKRQDQVIKPELYAQIGVRELFLYDPTIDYLAPGLQGYRLEGGRYVAIEANSSGAVESNELQVRLRLNRERLVIEDSITGLPLLTGEEAQEARAVAAEQKLQAMEAEMENLRRQLKSKNQ